MKCLNSQDGGKYQKSALKLPGCSESLALKIHCFYFGEVILEMCSHILLLKSTELVSLNFTIHWREKGATTSIS